MKAEERVAARARAKVPAGMRQLPEEERVSTLEDLIATRAELNKMIDTMPISMRSENLKSKKRECEEKLKQVESAITLFQRKIVYVKE